MNGDTGSNEIVRYWAAAAVTALLVFILSVVVGDDSFERFFGRSPPLLVTAVVLVIGAISLRVLGGRGWLPAQPLDLARLPVLGLIGAGFALPAVVMDSLIPFPEDMNT
ncbi:MAG: hypothetical protein ACN4GZ_06900, partial [Acidimicrobiales bacterium]